MLTKANVTRSNFSCNLHRNKRCVASCKKQFECDTPFCNCNCCVASCKKSRTTLYFSQRCETSCLRVTCLLQLKSNFVRMRQSELIFRKMSATSCVRHLVCRCTRCKLRKKLQTCDTPSATERFFISHRCVASCKKNCLVLHGLN